MGNKTFYWDGLSCMENYDKRNFVIIAADSVAVDEVTKLIDVGYNFGQVIIKISSFSPSC